VLLAAAAIFAVGLGLPLSPLAPAVGMHAPPSAFYPLLAGVVAGYGGLVLLTRAGYRKAFGCWL
jgi:Mg2+-importing ATPase